MLVFKILGDGSKYRFKNVSPTASYKALDSYNITAPISLEEVRYLKSKDTLIEKRLVACVQISGLITSTYWWQGLIEVAQEWAVRQRCDKICMM